GIITTFCIVNVPFPGQKMKIPFLAASILLDGSDIPMLHLIGDCELSDVRMGMRVKAVWRPKEEWDYTTENIKYFSPTGEPDAPFDLYKEHL
ncbi:MAG: DNA-binding protein, partial [Deltaproteobacteria bacterium]|nr:DNA-binding protein [Deltaproteobacteria bacterium]